MAMGGTSSCAAAAAWRGREHAGSVAILAGTVLTGWIVAQVLIIGPRSLLQPVMGGVGVTLIMLGAALTRDGGAGTWSPPPVTWRRHSNA